MPVPTSKKALTALFRELGAIEPAQWAASQIDEEIPQLHRFLFLREAWKYIPAEGEHSWIEREMDSAVAQPDAPYAGLGQVLAKCKQLGVSDDDLTEMARCLQAQMLFSVGYLLDAGPQDVPEQLEDISWGLFAVNEDNEPVGAPIEGLHESVLEMDPTNREMRPR